MNIVRVDTDMCGRKVEWGTDHGYWYTRTAGMNWSMTTKEVMEEWNPASTRNKYNDPGTSHREIGERLAQWNPTENWAERGRAEDTSSIWGSMPTASSET